MVENIVFVPGLLCTADLFADQLANLVHPGSASVADTLSDDTLGGMADRLLGAAPKRFALIGLSMGGYVAFEVLKRAPERVEKLILIDTSARGDREEQKQARRDIVELARREGILAANDLLFPRLVAAAAQGNAALRRRINRMAEEVGVERFAAQQDAIIARPDSREQLRSLALPTLVIVGEEDAITPPKVAEEMVALLPDARLERIAGCGHMATMERPEEVTRLIAEFLDVPVKA